jgi:ParB family chromosome partitioning protein
MTYPSTLPVKMIQPGRYNPRRYMDDAEMQELVSSIKAKGVLQSILLRPTEDGGFECIAGNRRLRAAREAHGEDYEVPVLVREMDDAEADEVALIENIDRADMNPAEEAEACAKILGRCNGDRDEAARRLGFTRDKFDKRLPLMNCSQKVRDALIERKILLGHAELLAAVPKDVQDKVVERLLSEPVLVSVQEFKAGLESRAKELSSAIFDKSECVACQHNSANQRSLFAEAVQDGKCTHGSCFDKKTMDELESRKAALVDEFPTVKIVNPGENFTVIKIVAEGSTGVGVDQAQACRACSNYGAAVSNIPGSIGTVYRNQCFDTACNTKMVAKRIKAEEEAAKAAVEAKATPEKGKQEAKTASSKPATSTTTTEVQDSTRVKEYRGKVWRKMFRDEVFSSDELSLTVLLTLSLTGHGREFNRSTLCKMFNKLTGDSESMFDLGETATKVAAAPSDARATLLRAMAPSVESSLEERYIVQLLTFINADLAKHWQLNAEYLGILTKSEIDAVANEIGLKAHLGEKFSPLMGKKKDEIIKGLLNAEGFDYYGKIPKSMQLPV